MDAAENKALIRRFYAEIDAGNIDAMDELVAEDHVDHNPPPFPGLPGGREGLKAAFRIFWEATAGRHEIADQIAEGDKGVTRLVAHGRHERDLPGPLPGDGRGDGRPPSRSTASAPGGSSSTGRTGTTSD